MLCALYTKHCAGSGVVYYVWVVWDAGFLIPAVDVISPVSFDRQMTMFSRRHRDTALSQDKVRGINTCHHIQMNIQDKEHNAGCLSSVQGRSQRRLSQWGERGGDDRGQSAITGLAGWCWHAKYLSICPRRIFSVKFKWGLFWQDGKIFVHLNEPLWAGNVRGMLRSGLSSDPISQFCVYNLNWQQWMEH